MPRFPYISADGNLETSMPRLPLNLINGNRIIEVLGLVDTGSSVNVLPYQAGLALGAEWDEKGTPIPLVGSLSRSEARGLLVMASNSLINSSAPVRLSFAWPRDEQVPVILGQMNFFLTFDVCFYRSQGFFEVNIKGK